MTSTFGATPTNGSSSDGAVAHAKDVALEKTEDVRRKIGSSISESVKTQADDRSTAIGEHVSTIASALQGTSSKLQESGEGAPAKALDAVTEQVRHLGDYLTNTSGESLLHDLEDAARRRPWATAAVMFGVGIAAARVLGASSRDRYESRGGTVAPRPTYSSFPASPSVTPAFPASPSVTSVDGVGGSLAGGAGNASY